MVCGSLLFLPEIFGGFFQGSHGRLVRHWDTAVREEGGFTQPMARLPCGNYMMVNIG